MPVQYEDWMTILMESITGAIMVIITSRPPLVFADTLTGYLQECIDKTGIVSKALLSSDWHHEWDSVQATLQSVSAVLFLF